MAHVGNENQNESVNHGSRRGLSRRRFVVATSTVAAGVAVLPSQAVFASTNVGAGTGLESLHMSAFGRCEGQRFTASHDGTSVTLELVSVTDLGTGPKASERAGECFALRFRHVSGPALVQDTYTMHNHALGQFPLFIVPGDQRKRTRSGTAIINRQG